MLFLNDTMGIQCIQVRYLYKDIYQIDRYLPKTKGFDRTNSIKNSFIIVFVQVELFCIFIYVKFNMFSMDSSYRHTLYNHVFSSVCEIKKAL